MRCNTYSDLERIREGISSKFSMLTQYVSTFISGLLVGFYISPKLTGLLLLVGPIIIGIMAFLSLVRLLFVTIYNKYLMQFTKISTCSQWLNWKQKNKDKLGI